MEHKTRTKVLSWLLSLALMLSLVPGMSLSALAADNSKYREYTWDATSKTLSYEDKNIPDDAITLTAESTAWADSGWYIVPEEGVTVSSRITVTGTVNLILCDGATLTAGKGITVNSSNTLNIYAQSAGTGELSAGNDGNAASIGGGARYQSGGTVNIHGGNITAIGGYYAAGIGGALDGGNGEVNIYGGNVTAQGNNFAAGIGGYSKKSGGTVSIYGGTVNASGSINGVGIGIGGTEPGSCIVNIYGGDVIASSVKQSGIQGTVNIGGGTVTANGGTYDGLSGYSGTTVACNGISGTVTISGGTVTATGGSVTGTVDSYGGNIYASSGIGGTVTISGGTVVATGGNATADIKNYGGNIYVCDGISGIVTINGGTVTATGGSHTGSTTNYRGTTEKGEGFGGSLTIGDSMKVLGGDSADPTTEIEKSNGDYARFKYMIVKLGHAHSFTYTASGATITATCGSHDGCPLASSDYKATLTISAPTTSDGKAVVTVKPAGAFGTLPAVKYKTGSGEETETPPTADGFHKASITVDGKTASVTYGMNCITYSAATNGSVSGSAGATVGATVEPTITPATGYELDTLTVKQGDQDVTVTGNKSFVMPEADVTVSATFKKINSAITVTQPTGGTVTAKNNGADVTAADYDDTITLGNTPAAGYNFTSYSVTKTGDSTSVAVDNGTFKMPEYPVTVTGTFTPIDYTVTVSATTNGTVGANKTTAAHIGEEITLTVTPSAGYQLDALTVKDANNQNVTVSGSKFTMPASNVTVSATFKEITYAVTVNGAKATVKDSTPEQQTYTAELKNVPADKTYDGEPITLTATVQQSTGFPTDKVTVGSVSFKDQNNNIVTTATDVGTYTASATVGDKTISKSFTINGQTTPITYVKTTKSGSSYTAVLATTNQYIPLVNNPNGITLLKEGRVYYAKGNIEIGALVFIGNDVKLILGKDTTVTIYAGIYHIGSSLEIYSEQGGEASSLIVNGSKTLSELTNNTGHTLDEIAGKDATLSGTIGVYSGKLTVEKGNNSKLVADDINLTLGAGVSASGLTGGTANDDGMVLYNKESLSGVDKLSLEYKAPATNTTPSSGSGSSSSSTPSSTTTTTTTTDATSNPDASTTSGTATVTTTKNADGSTTEKTTETATKSGEDGSKTEVKAEATTTTKSNTDGTTTAATTTTETATTTAADGTKTVTETKTEAKETLNKSGNGTVEAKTTETVKDESGRVTATTVTESKGTVETATDGTKTTTTTNTAVTTDAAGNKTTVVTTEKATVTTDGNTGKVVSDESGKVVSVEAKVSETAAESAAKSGETVTLPVTVTAAQSAEDATAVAITVPKAAESVKVEIPVEDVKPGTVAVIVHEDGSEEIVKTSTTGTDGVVLTLDGGASIKIVDNTKDFVDVSGREWYADNVAWASSREVMNGVGNNAFAPNEVTTTGMVAQILMNLSGETANPNTAAEKYSDIKANDWFAAPISWLTEADIAQGEGDEFGATEAITRERDIVLLHNYAQHMGYDTSARADLNRFADAGSVSDWARDAMAWAVGAGIINGTTDGSRNVVLDPQGSATRAQVTAMTERFCKKTAR